MSTEICANCKFCQELSNIKINVGRCINMDRYFEGKDTHVKGFWTCKHFERKKDKQ